MEVVQAYLNAEGGYYRYLASKYNIPAKEEELKNGYTHTENLVKKGLMRSRQNKIYFFNLSFLC